MNSACEHRKTMAEELFEHEINNIPQSLCKDGKKGIELYHGSKAEITKRLNSPYTLPTSVMLPHDQEGKSAIVAEMSPLIRAKAFATHTGSLTNFGEFAVLVYYELNEYLSLKLLELHQGNQIMIAT